MVFNGLKIGEVNRAEAVFHKAAGKGVNFARAAKTAGFDARVFQFAGGETGRAVCRGLEDEGIEHFTIFEDSAPTRTCVTCLCRKSSSMTELIEPSAEISEVKTADLLDALLEALPEAAALALCGTYPPGVTSGFYTEAVKGAVRAKIPVLMDVCADIDAALKAGVTYLKINMAELFKISGEEGGALKAAARCMGKYPLKALAVTSGPERAILAHDGKIWEYCLPRLEKVLNPLGAGDTASAVFLCSMLEGKSPSDAFADGLAAASASCLTMECAVFSPETAKNIRRQIRFQPI